MSEPASAYELLSSEPTANEHIHTSIFRDGIFPTQETTPMWDVSRTEDNSAAGLASMLEVLDYYSG